MHFVTDVQYEGEYKLRLWFEDNSERIANLEEHLDGEVFEPLKDRRRFRTVRLNSDLDTVVWANGADMSPDFLYEISEPVTAESPRRVAEGRAMYATGKNQRVRPT